MTDAQDSINVWAEIMSQITIDDEKAKVRERQWRADHIDEWWRGTVKDLPTWRFARYGNKAWESRCDGRVLRAVSAWAPFRLRQGKLVASSLALCAPSGAGKSTAVLARLHETARRMREATLEGKSTVRYPPGILWVTEQQLLASQEERNFKLLNEARDVSMLVLDEFGFGGGHEAIKGRTPIGLDVLCNRYDKELATVITSGLSMLNIARRYGVAIARRIENESTICDLLAGVDSGNSGRKVGAS